MQIIYRRILVFVLICVSNATALDMPFSYLKDVDFTGYFNNEIAIEKKFNLPYPPGGGDVNLAEKSEIDLRNQRNKFNSKYSALEIETHVDEYLKIKNYWGLFYFVISFSNTDREEEVIQILSRKISLDSTMNFCICYSSNIMIRLIWIDDINPPAKKILLKPAVKKAYFEMINNIRITKKPVWSNKIWPDILSSNP